MITMTFTVDELDYATIQKEIARRQSGTRMTDPNDPSRTVPCLPDGDSDMIGAMIAEIIRDLNDYRDLRAGRTPGWMAK